MNFIVGNFGSRVFQVGRRLSIFGASPLVFLAMNSFTAAIAGSAASWAFGFVVGAAHVHEAGDHHAELRGLHLDHSHLGETAGHSHHAHHTHAHAGAGPSFDGRHMEHHEGDALYLTVPAQRSLESAQAPPAMVAQYGPANGFGWKHDEVVGAQIMSVPMTVPEGAAQRAFLTFMGALLVVFVAIVAALNLLLRRLVVQPVVGLARTADDISRGEVGVAPFQTQGKDEIALLATSFNRMRRSLEKALKMIAA